MQMVPMQMMAEHKQIELSTGVREVFVISEPVHHADRHIKAARTHRQAIKALLTVQ